jgi:hypothetical protein
VHNGKSKYLRVDAPKLITSRHISQPCRNLAAFVISGHLLLLFYDVENQNSPATCVNAQFSTSFAPSFQQMLKNHS